MNCPTAQSPERPHCPRCGARAVLLPLDGVTREEIMRAPFLLLRCEDLACDAGSAIGLVAATPKWLLAAGMLPPEEATSQAARCWRSWSR